MPRYHYLDRLRACMMLLGVVRHAAMSYEPNPFEGWPYKDAQANFLAHWVIAFIRVFQLPVFFVIAGFFAAYLVQTRGITGFLRHRWSRVGVPFLAAWPILAVVMYFALRFASQFSSNPPSYSYSVAELNSAHALRYLFMHLWFLYHLMILCLVAAGVRLLAVRVPAGVRGRALDLFERFAHRGGIAALIAIAGLILFRMESWEIDYYAGPLPPLRLLALWGLFFTFGWLLFCRRRALEGFKRPAWGYLTAGIACFFAYRLLADAGCQAGPDRVCAGESDALHLGAVGFLALSMWFMSYSLIGLFLRHLDRASARWRYLVDASYWIYLAHVPFVMLLPLILAGAPIPGVLKLAFVSLAAVGLTLLIYRHFVRSTFIGRQLNGRRYQSGST
jgi:hypothetical protein